MTNDAYNYIMSFFFFQYIDSKKEFSTVFIHHVRYRIFITRFPYILQLFRINNKIHCLLHISIHVLATNSILFSLKNTK